MLPHKVGALKTIPLLYICVTHRDGLLYRNISAAEDIYLEVLKDRTMNRELQRLSEVVFVGYFRVVFQFTKLAQFACLQLCEIYFTAQ